jgi:uncharacterized protein (TIGR00369 family)
MKESFGAYIPFVELLGFELVFFEDGQSELVYTPEPEHLNSFNVTHGGALMTFMDVGLATAARSVDKGMGVITIEMKTSFMQAAKGTLTVKSRLMHRSRNLAFTEGTIYDSEGNACVHASGTFKYVARAPENQTPDSLHEVSTD